MTLSAVSTTKPGDKPWSAAVDAATENSGADPYLVWTTALSDQGSETHGPDSTGEYSSNCPNPGHNGGSGDAKASLRWRQLPDQQIVFHCHAKCDAEDITTTLGITFVQLRWPRTQYTYRNELRELLAVHVKTPTAGGKKRYWWEHDENGVLVTGRGSGWEPVLWLLPDLQHTAQQARNADRPIHLWLVEGERDVIHTTYAIEQGWTPPDQRDWCHLVTTSADGAAVWERDLTKQCLELGPTQITILCDSDEAGTRRGQMVTESIIEADPTANIANVNWGAHAGIKDVTDAVNRFGPGWLREASAADQADAYLWCSAETGWMFEADINDLDGTPTGKRALHRMTQMHTRNPRPEAITKWPVRVVASTIDQNGDAVGWELDLGPGGTRPIRADDLVGGAIEAWNSKIGLFITQTRGMGPALRAYLGYHGHNSPTMAVWDHEGWVSEDVFVTGAEILIGPAGLIGRAEAGVTEWHYGQADPTEAARICAELLTFRPLNEAAPVLAWLAAVSVRPRSLTASGASFVPMLQIPGDSGTGKTSFLRLATRLFGLSGQAISNVTTAGLVRTLALSTQVVWIDDFANYDDTVRDIIRGGLTGAGRTRGTTASERGIVRDEARAALVNSGETAMGLDERAMRQRCVVVPFTERAQGRVSRRDQARGQYADMVEFGVDKNDHGLGLSRWAGSVITGLWEQAQKPGECTLSRHEHVGDGVREAAAWRFIEYGAEVLARYLAAHQIPADRIDKMLRCVYKAVDTAVAGAVERERSGADIHLVTTLVPAYLRARRTLMDTAVSARLREHDELDPVTVQRAIRDSWREADAALASEGRPARGAVLVIGPSTDPDAEGGQVVRAIALCSSSLAEWACSDEGRRAGIGADRRFVSKEGIGMQAMAVADRQMEGGGAVKGNGKLRVKLCAGQSPLYTVITRPEVITAILGA